MNDEIACSWKSNKFSLKIVDNDNLTWQQCQRCQRRWKFLVPNYVPIKFESSSSRSPHFIYFSVYSSSSSSFSTAAFPADVDFFFSWFFNFSLARAQAFDFCIADCANTRVCACDTHARELLVVFYFAHWNFAKPTKHEKIDDKKKCEAKTNEQILDDFIMWNLFP